MIITKYKESVEFLVLDTILEIMQLFLLDNNN